jgi:hypothetical protein
MQELVLYINSGKKGKKQTAGGQPERPLSTEEKRSEAEQGGPSQPPQQELLQKPAPPPHLGAVGGGDAGPPQEYRGPAGMIIRTFLCRHWHPSVYIKSFVGARYIIIITLFQITVATCRQVLTLCISISYLVCDEQVHSFFFFRCTASVMCVLDSIFIQIYVKCSVLYKGDGL